VTQYRYVFLPFKDDDDDDDEDFGGIENYNVPEQTRLRGQVR
jgi:hypothetical protein